MRFDKEAEEVRIQEVRTKAKSQTAKAKGQEPSCKYLLRESFHIYGSPGSFELQDFELQDMELTTVQKQT